MIASFVQRILRLASRRADASVRCKVLFVCMHNLCRSPTAEAVFRHQVGAAGLAREIACASAGTHDFNLGSVPDGRARAAALKRGYDMSRQRARAITSEDFTRYDLILAMDRPILEALRERCPQENAGRLRLLMEFARRDESTLDVPDPYYGNAQGFEVVLDMIEDACATLLEHVRSTRLGQEERSAAG